MPCITSVNLGTVFGHSGPSRTSRGVDAHLLVIPQLIQVRFQRSRPTNRSTTEIVVDRVILEAFTFHASMSIPFQKPTTRPMAIELALSLAESCLQDQCHDEVFYHSRSPVLSVSLKLFVCIREIALMYQCSLDGVDLSRCYELQETVTQLEQKVSMRMSDRPTPLYHSPYIPFPNQTSSVSDSISSYRGASSSK
ncbi:hypothetical protein EYZ11_003891 [Aspergillus tanneri]|uniref:Transcription factor domain-containing protein n=1 Tax=Aspergillus tanneri TaxID=1220188 RepID=A0A4S3JST3_9EURO|nr:uncharacterized protein ATNIH1004_009359 [Aspergillus tanneri]KAA8645142.1 hypothetical protein ATNIH1004_009359 [Aspergillus tanneri]THC96641.1 hypothetical protein EYZ11_003891 [Aspergillus tanneri]